MTWPPPARADVAKMPRVRTPTPSQVILLDIVEDCIAFFFYNLDVSWSRRSPRLSSVRVKHSSDFPTRATRRFAFSLQKETWECNAWIDIRMITSNCYFRSEARYCVGE